MLTCPYCGTSNVDQHNFCANCENQIKCLQCGTALLENKSRCLNCGTRLEVEPSNSSAVNTFTLEEKHSTTSSYRKIEGQFTDNAFSQAASLFGGLNLPQPAVQSRIVRQPAKAPASLPMQRSLLPAAEADDIDQVYTDADEPTVETPVLAPPVSAPTSSENAKQAASYFELDGEDNIISRLSDFKGKNKQDQQKRFMLMYIYAFNQLVGKPVASKNEVMKALKGKGIYDNNCHGHYIDVEKRFLSKTTVGLKINLEGQKEVERITNDIENDQIAGFQDWGKVKTRDRHPRLTRDNENRLKDWLDAQVDLNGFDVRKLKTPTNYAMFAIWVVTTQIQDVKALKPGEIFEYLKRKYSAIPVSQDSISSALTRPYNASKFQKTSEKSYYLTPEAESTVSLWVQSGEVDGKGDLAS